MAKVIFYGKPGCINNEKQKKLLIHSGHIVEDCNLLEANWDEGKLLKYFASIPVSQWFNLSAPDIKRQHVIPAQLSAQQAINLMIENPILIRRPLMQVGDDYRVGFNQEDVDKWIGLNYEEEEDLEGCPNLKH